VTIITFNGEEIQNVSNIYPATLNPSILKYDIRGKKPQDDEAQQIRIGEVSSIEED